MNLVRALDQLQNPNTGMVRTVQPAGQMRAEITMARGDIFLNFWWIRMDQLYDLPPGEPRPIL